MNTSTSFSASKNIIIPLSIIIVAVLIGGVVLFSGGKVPSNVQLVASDANLRKLELLVPGMFCPGCVAGVEGYVSSLPGVTFVKARLTPTKSATIIYKPDQITKEQIIKNLNNYGYGPATIIYDASFNPTTEN